MVPNSRSKRSKKDKDAETSEGSEDSDKDCISDDKPLRRNTVTLGGVSANNCYVLAGRIDIVKECLGEKLDLVRAARTSMQRGLVGSRGSQGNLHGVSGALA